MNYKTKIPLMMYLFVLSALLLATALPLWATDDQQSPSNPQDETGDKQTVVEHETGFYYTIQKGDTLWDLSQKFSDSPWQWTELWQENRQIANPHRIYPGERIRLYRRKEAHKYGEINKGTLPPKSPSPESIEFFYASIDQVGFIRKEPVVPHGTLYKVREPKVMIYEGDLVYVRPEGDFTLTPGSRYTVYRTLKPIIDVQTNAFIGIQHYLTGVVEIVQQEAQYSIAKVIKAYRPIKLNDMLMPFNRRLPRIAMRKSQEGIEGRIIEGEEHQTIMGDDIIAFIDKGQQDGIEPGQFYSIYYQDQHRVQTEAGEKSLFTPVDIGELFTIHIEKTTATVLITRTEKAVEAGTRIRTPLP